VRVPVEEPLREQIVVLAQIGGEALRLPRKGSAGAWRPFRTWAAAHIRTLREERTHEISGPTPAG